MATISYKLAIKTCAKYAKGGTDATVEIKLVGMNNIHTEWKTLDHWCCNDFERGSVGKYDVTMKDVGMPAVVHFRLKDGASDDWACDYVVVSREGESKTFPLYTFVEKEVAIIGSETELPQKVTQEVISDQRKENLFQLQGVVDWAHKHGGQNYWAGSMSYTNAKSYDDLPKFMQKSTDRQQDFILNGIIGVVTTKLDALATTPGLCFGTSYHKLENLDSYRFYYEHLDCTAQYTPDFLNGWKTDEGFGWQILNGILPQGFTACKEIPSYFNVTDADLNGMLGCGKTISSEIEAGKLYITDYTETYDITSGLRYRAQSNGVSCMVAQAVCLFYVSDDGHFLPAAIQLVPNDPDYLFIAEEKSDDWLLAKMYFRNASFAIHEWVYHFLYTHATVEPFEVASYRCLSRAHPVYKLLRPHVRTVAAINAQARVALLLPSSLPAPGISVDAKTMINLFYKTYNLDKLNIPKVLKETGVDPDKIPFYHYGQDTLKLWKIVGDYVEAMIKLYYKSDQDVVEDTELQSFAHEVAHDGFGWEDGNTRGMPDKFETREKLIEICTLVICTSGVQHAAVNFGQYETGKFVPNFPSIMNLPPHKRGEANLERIMATLPTSKQCSGVIALLYALSKYSRAEELLGQFAEHWFYEEEAVAIQEAFQDDLKKLEAELIIRNENVHRPYLHQMPTNVPNSIAI